MKIKKELITTIILESQGELDELGEIFEMARLYQKRYKGTLGLDRARVIFDKFQSRIFG